MARQHRRRCRPGTARSILRCAGVGSAAGALAVLRERGALGAFATAGTAARGPAAGASLTRPPQKAGSSFVGAAADLRLRRTRTARNLFDTGSFFGVGVPEAIIVGLLGWFLLGPEELYRLAKQAGGWLGELRTFVGQAAGQYEKALDDESTRKAIEGIRKTQQTVADVATQWRSVSDTFRDPLNLSSTFAGALNPTLPKTEDEKKEDAKKPETKAEKKAKADASKGYPDLTADGEPEDLEESEGVLEAKKANSREAAKDLWFTGNADEDEDDIPKLDIDGMSNPDRWLIRLDDRLDELEGMTTQLEELRAGIEQDRAMLKKALEDRAKEAEEAKAAKTEEAPEKKEKKEKTPAEAAVASGGIEA